MPDHALDLVTGDLRLGLDDTPINFTKRSRSGTKSGERTGHARVTRNISPSRARVARAV